MKTVSDAVDIAKRAGVEIMKIYQTDFEVDTKADASPVTQADRVADALIVQAIKDEITADYPIVSEESFEEGKTQVDEDAPFWLVDPLDGTKQFVAKRGEFTVNIALIEAGRPVLGVVHAPALNVTYWGSRNGAFLRIGDQEKTAISVRPKPDGGIAAVVSRSHKTPETDDFMKHFTVTEEVSCGSSIKFCRIAEGAADLYPRLGRTMEWDTAAGHAVLMYAGGIVLREGAVPMGYGKPGFENPHFFACSEALSDDVAAVIS